MIEAMIAGERDPQKLAGLARGRMKVKRAALTEALTGRSRPTMVSWPGCCWTRSMR